MIRRPPISTLSSSSAASDVYKRQEQTRNAESKWPSSCGGHLCLSHDQGLVQTWTSSPPVPTYRRAQSHKIVASPSTATFPNRLIPPNIHLSIAAMPRASVAD